MDSPAWRQPSTADPAAVAVRAPTVRTADDGAPAMAVRPVSGVVLVLLLDYRARHCPWGWMQLAARGRGWADTPGLRFAKVMGSGHGGGFTLRPSASHQGVIALFDGEASALAFAHGPRVASMRARARSHWLGVLQVISARGAWDGRAWQSGSPAAPARPPPGAPAGPIAVLTRASIRPWRAAAFWRHAPAAQAALAHAEGCELAMGLGEAPMLRQCTFSLWRDAAALEAYARQGAHQHAARNAQHQGFFSESMFVRMALRHAEGRWPARGDGDG